MQYTHTSELLVSGLIRILPTISVMFLKHENNFLDMKRLINVYYVFTIEVYVVIKMCMDIN